VTTRRGEPAIKPDQIKAVLDLAGKDSGVYNVPIALVAPDVVVQSLSPASVSLTISKLEQRSLPLAFHYTNGEAGSLVVDAAVLQPANVVVRGPSDELADVAAVRVDIAVPAQPETLDEMVRAVPVDASGQEVSGLDVSPDLVRARVDFVRGTGIKK
jgi:YbbR domain-containing protein